MFYGTFILKKGEDNLLSIKWTKCEKRDNDCFEWEDGENYIKPFIEIKIHFFNFLIVEFLNKCSTNK